MVAFNTNYPAQDDSASAVAPNNVKTERISQTIIVPAAAWTATNPSTATVYVPGIRADMGDFSVGLSSKAQYSIAASAGLGNTDIIHGDGTITLTAIGVTPTEDISVNVVIYRSDAADSHFAETASAMSFDYLPEQRTEIMDELFITKISVRDVRNIKDLEIVLSDHERKHLILTGKNGSGKTSLLEAMRDNITQRLLQGATPLSLNFNIPLSYTDTYSRLFAYIPAQRPSNLIVPKSIQKTPTINKADMLTDASRYFLQYMLHMNYQLLASQTDEEKRRLGEWFLNFTEALQEIYNCAELELQHDAKNLTFRIAIPGLEPFGLNEMADGYSALLKIVMELMIRMGGGGATTDYGQPGIVFVDEIETHLHVELQKRVLPFLTRLFPNIQFIVTTHSPFIITSLDNAVVFDLEKRERLENPTVYSYETVVEVYLDADMYSERMKALFDRYKALCFKERNAEENTEFLKAKSELELVPPANKELYLAFEELETKRKAFKNGQNQ
jgi:predicted ATPase